MYEGTDYDDRSLGYTKRLIVERDTAIGARANRIV